MNRLRKGIAVAYALGILVSGVVINPGFAYANSTESEAPNVSYSDGPFVIVSAASGYCLTDGNNPIGDTVTQHSCNGTANQKWYTDGVVGGSQITQFKNAGNGGCMTAEGTANTAVYLTSCNYYSRYENFSFLAQGGTDYSIVSAANDLYLTNLGSTQDNTNIEFATSYTGSLNQIFDFEAGGVVTALK